MFLHEYGLAVVMGVTQSDALCVITAQFLAVKHFQRLANQFLTAQFCAVKFLYDSSILSSPQRAWYRVGDRNQTPLIFMACVIVSIN